MRNHLSVLLRLGICYAEQVANDVVKFFFARRDFIESVIGLELVEGLGEFDKGLVELATGVEFGDSDVVHDGGRAESSAGGGIRPDEFSDRGGVDDGTKVMGFRPVVHSEESVCIGRYHFLISERRFDLR